MLGIKASWSCSCSEETTMTKTAPYRQIQKTASTPGSGCPKCFQVRLQWNLYLMELTDIWSRFQLQLCQVVLLKCSITDLCKPAQQLYPGAPSVSCGYKNNLLKNLWAFPKRGGHFPNLCAYFKERSDPSMQSFLFKNSWSKKPQKTLPNKERVVIWYSHVTCLTPSGTAKIPQLIANISLTAPWSGRLSIHVERHCPWDHRKWLQQIYKAPRYRCSHSNVNLSSLTKLQLPLLFP